MKIDSIVANPVPAGQLVIGQGDGLDAAHKLLFGDKPGPFKRNSAGDIETEVPRDSDTVEVTTRTEDGHKSNGVSFTFLGELSVRPSVVCVRSVQAQDARKPRTDPMPEDRRGGCETASLKPGGTAHYPSFP